MRSFLESAYALVADIKTFSVELSSFIIKLLHLNFIRFENVKGVFVVVLYKQRGKMAKRLIHSGMASIAALGIMIAPVVAQEFPGRSVDPWSTTTQATVLSATTDAPATTTDISNVRGNIIEYEVQEGDTVSSIAQKFDITEDTIRWQNNLGTRTPIKIGQKLQILPVAGVAHKVQKGDTVESIAKKYDSSAQAIVDFPFNSFSNDETFELAIGQTVIVPDGQKPDPTFLATTTPRARQITPDAGTVVASGQFVWPTQGVITQRFAWYHPAIDVANPGLPNILAADAGRVISAGWDPSGYGNKVIIDHGNGNRTLYAHMSQIYVVVGQSVNRGGAIGKMGSTGRSTGPHLHFEVYTPGGRVNPLSVLR